MSKKYDGWIVRNKWGSFLLWTMGYLKRDVIKIVGKEEWRSWNKEGHQIVKVKLVEVE